VASPARTGPIVRIAADILRAIEAEAAAAHPLEACGLLIGRRMGGDFEVTRHAPSRNLAASPHKHFEIDPLLQLHWQKALRGTEEAVIGHYHSHPKGTPEPSPTDIADAHDPTLLWLITGLEPPRTHAFTLNERQGSPRELQVLTTPA
jgi:proteasome lid subunit RPN8/RPN11